MKTIYSHFRDRAVQQPKRKALAWKGPRIWSSWNYGEVLVRVDRLADGLIGKSIAAGDRLAILSENCPEWAICDLAINKAGAVSVPIHVTANDETVEYIIRDSASGYLFASRAVFHDRRELLQRLTEAYGLRVVLFDLTSRPGQHAHGDISLLSGLSVKDAPQAARAHELASIIYTSGTTGEPKGVMLSNQNILRNIEGVFDKFEITFHDRFLSFLPLSHVLERTLGHYVPLCSGASIAYAEGIQKLSRNLKEVKPTIIIGVPRIFDKTKQKIFFNMRSKNFLVKKLFFLSLKKDNASLVKKLADRLIYKKIRQIFGGRLRFAVSGGAAINERILRFYNSVDIKIVEGYGLTETSPIVTCNTVEHRVIGSVGRPLSCVEVKISEDKEILTRGECVMMGYWGKADMTKEAIGEDGWFRTGDLGFLSQEGHLTIIGRKKDIIVTSNGKNIFPEKIENEINLSPYISQSLVVGHKQPHLAALIVVDTESIRQEFGDTPVDVQALVKKELDKANQKLPQFEAIRGFKIIDTPFTIESDELTATLKVRRHMIEKHYAAAIAVLFK